MQIKEKDLDQAFADAFQASRQFQRWLLAGGRFAKIARNARLLGYEMARVRGIENHWWRHCWCKLPDGSESETDLFFPFDADRMRFAIHIENKPKHGKLSFDQAAGYRPRAIYMAHKPQWLEYWDFETILLAPNAFLEDNLLAIRQFDRVISYEKVAEFVPLFREAI